MSSAMKELPWIIHHCATSHRFKYQKRNFLWTTLGCLLSKGGQGLLKVSPQEGYNGDVLEEGCNFPKGGMFVGQSQI